MTTVIRAAAPAAGRAAGAGVESNYFADLQAAQTEMLKAQGLSEDQIRTQVAAAAAMQTPVMNALSGFIGTVVTGVIVAALAGAVWRKK